MVEEVTTSRETAWKGYRLRTPELKDGQHGIPLKTVKLTTAALGYRAEWDTEILLRKTPQHLDIDKDQEEIELKSLSLLATVHIA